MCVNLTEKENTATKLNTCPLCDMALSVNNLTRISVALIQRCVETPHTQHCHTRILSLVLARLLMRLQEGNSLFVQFPPLILNNPAVVPLPDDISNSCQ